MSRSVNKFASIRELFISVHGHCMDLELSRIAPKVRQSPPETAADDPEPEPGTMTKRAHVATLADIDAALAGSTELTPVRCRDLRSANRRVARLLGQEPTQIPLDVPTISQRLAACMPAATGMSEKTFANVKSDFLAAVKAAGLAKVPTKGNAPMSSNWRELMAELSSKRMHLGLSRLAGWGSDNGIEPAQLNDDVIAAFIDAVRQSTLHRKPNELHRNVAKIWNEAASTRHHLQRVTVPSFRRPVQRLDLAVFPKSLQNEIDAYASWSVGSNPFATDARSRPLAPQTIRLQRNHIRAALTALVDSGISPGAMTSLAELVAIDNVRRILRRRHEMVGGENVFNRDLARTLTEIARLWVKVDPPVLDELKRLARKVPAPLPGLTNKNKATLRQFDDPANLRRLVELPARLWAEVKRDQNPNYRTLLQAQVALAVGISCYMPLRPQNLCALKYDEHIFLHDVRGGISSLEIPASEAKNKREIAFDIPTALVKMLVEYRNRLVPKVIGCRSERLFVNPDGSAKTQWALSWLVRTVVRRRTGLQISLHQFRHLAARTVLDGEPGAFETVRQLLGHSSQRTSVSSYAGMDTRRAARHHQLLLERALQAEKRQPGRPIERDR